VVSILFEGMGLVESFEEVHESKPQFALIVDNSHGAADLIITAALSVCRGWAGWAREPRIPLLSHSMQNDGKPWKKISTLQVEECCDY